jgi:hypothetical protein
VLALPFRGQKYFIRALHTAKAWHTMHMCCLTTLHVRCGRIASDNIALSNPSVFLEDGPAMRAAKRGVVT